MPNNPLQRVKYMEGVNGTVIVGDICPWHRNGAEINASMLSKKRNFSTE